MFQNSSGTRPVGPPDSYLASPFFSCKWRPSLQASFGRNLYGMQENKALSFLAEERKGSTHSFLVTTVSEKLPWATVAKDKRFHLKGGNSICSFVDSGVRSSRRLKTYSAGLCLARNSSESLPLRSQLLRPSVYVLTIFGNGNQRGQWLSSRGCLY